MLAASHTRTLASENSLTPDYDPSQAGLKSNPSGLPVLGRYNSVLNDGLFSSLQVHGLDLDCVCSPLTRFHSYAHKPVMSFDSPVSSLGAVMHACATPKELGCPLMRLQHCILLQVRSGSIIDDLAELEPSYLAKQNKEMRRLLVDCRKELYIVSGDVKKRGKFI